MVMVMTQIFILRRTSSFLLAYLHKFSFGMLAHVSESEGGKPKVGLLEVAVFPQFRDELGGWSISTALPKVLPSLDISFVANI